MGQLNRRAATKKGVLRRLRDVDLGQLTDHRKLRGRRYRHRAFVMALMLGMVAALRSLRQVGASPRKLDTESAANRAGRHRRQVPGQAR